MLKQIIAVAFLSSVALGQFNLFDRQWKEGDPREICWEVCNNYCPNCTEPVRCGEGEKKCGEKPIDPNMSQCPVDDVCVPDHCLCDYEGYNGETCERWCTVTCDETEILCSHPDTTNGCKVNDECVPKGKDDSEVELCDGACVVYCEDDENYCPKEPLPNGCKQEADCVPKQKDHDDNICSYQQCPLECEETHHLCEGRIDEYGCKEEDICVIKARSQTGHICPGTCPVECQNGEILCDGTIDYSPGIHKGCPGQDICNVKAKNEELVYCPPESASHLCPKTCPEIEVLCTPYEGPLGCKGPYECHARSKDNVDDYCPSTADCPIHCSTNEYNCNTGEDENGCMLPADCVEKTRGFDGEECPYHCPEVCTDSQLFCDGMIDETGCKGASGCHDKEEHKWGPGAEEDPKAECPGYCPAQCLSHEILCPSQLDPCNGCPTEEVCREAIKDKDGIFCAGKEESGQPTYPTTHRRGGYLSFSHNCPMLCREEQGFALCPAYEDETGCKPEAECVVRTTSDFGQWCPSHSVCPKQCPKGFKLCEYEDVDSQGCKVEPSCVYKGKNNYDLYCPGECPPICTKGQTLVSPGVDSDGCELPSVCLGDTNEEEAPVVAGAPVETDAVVEEAVVEEEAVEETEATDEAA